MAREVQVISGRMRQTFQDDEKRRIVEDSYASPLSLNQFAKKMGISPATLCQWRKTFKVGADCSKEPVYAPIVPLTQYVKPGQPMPIEELFAEYERLKAENAALKSSDVESLKTENAKLKAEFSQFKAYAMSKIYEFEAKKYA